MESYVPYWFAAQREEVESMWGAHPIYGNDSGHPMDVAGYQMLTAFYDNTFAQIETRRRLLYHYLKGQFGTEWDDALYILRATLPIGTFLPKIVNALCIAYNQAPTRTWKNAQGKEDARGTELLRQVYTQMGADGRLQIAYRKQKNCSGVALRPYIGGRGRMQLEILTPDLFRYQTASLFPDVLTEFVRPLLEYRNGKVRNVLQVWTDDELYYTDLKGNRTKYLNDDGEDTEGQKNPYGRIPYIIARLVEPDTMETFGAGMFDVAEANIVANKFQWLADNSITYESFGVWVAKNLGLADQPKIKLGPGRVIAVDGISKEDDAPGSLENVSNNGQYMQMSDFRKSYVEDIMLGIGLPESDVVKQGGNPPSGIARQIERMGLLEQRASDLPLLKLNEVAFSDLVTLVYNTDVAEQTRSQRIPEGLELSVEFKEEGILQEPAAQFDADVKALIAGVIEPMRFTKDHAGKDHKTNEEAVEYLLGNQRLVDAIRSGLTGGAPPAAEPDESVSIPGADIASPERVESEVNVEDEPVMTLNRNGVVTT